MSFGTFSASGSNPLEHVVQHPLWTQEADLGLLTQEGEITLLSDHILMLIAAGVLLMLFLPRLVRKRQGTDEVGRLVPSGFANFIEAICDYLRTEVAEPSLGPYTDRFIKYIWTVFFFILTLNLLGLLPLGAFAPWLFGIHFAGTATANLWVTSALAILSLVMWVYNGLRIGGKQYLAHFALGPTLLKPLMVFIEVIGLVAKTFSLAIRLFANMIAGHVLLAVLLSFIFSAAAAMGPVGGVGVAIPVVLGSIGIYLLEVFVAFLQAFIFTFLTALFLGMSVVFDHGEEHGEAHAH